MIDAERLKDRMEACGLSQAELARRVGVAQTSIFKLLSGRSYNSRYLHIIARELQTTAAYLTGETDDSNAELPDDVLTSQDREDISLLQRLRSTDRDAIRQLMRSLTADAAAPSAEPVPIPATVHSPVRSFAGKG